MGKPACPVITLDTRLDSLTNEGGRDPVVGWHETIAALDRHGVVTVRELFARGGRRKTKDCGRALYGAVRCCELVTPDMAKRVSYQLTTILEPLWEAHKAETKAAKKKQLADLAAMFCPRCRGKEGADARRS